MKSSPAAAAAFSTVLLLLVTFDSVFAQNAGDHVRVVIAGDTVTGDVTDTSETGFTVTLSSGLLSGFTREQEVEYGQVESLEVRTCCMRGARLIAVGGGLLLGWGLGEFTNDKTCSEAVILLPFPIVSETCTRTGNNELWGGLIGGAAGLAVALMVLTDRWEVIPHGDLGGVSLAPLAGLRPRYGGTTIILGTRVRF
ncbi:hypothetical protein [Candidatus Palauibacter sp.]|uniref:hypothetical protein n=1 Tax=Candidatus Palauibacter sp. TaxID=3101350 RepID=UPI003AF30B2A